MTLDKALNILGLKYNFNEEELKQAHKRLTYIHHPDKHENSEYRIKEEEIMKEINAAKDFLIQYLKTTSKLNIEEYLQRKLRELRNIVSQHFLADFAAQINDLSVDINTIFYELEDIPTKFYSKTYSYYRYTDIDTSYNEFLNEIKSKFKELEVYFFKENYINKDDIKEQIDYNCTLEMFCKQLLKIKDKYSKESILKKKIEEEISKYVYFVGYEKIEKQIKDIVRKYLNKIMIKRFKYSQNDIHNMHEEIKNLFSKYHILKQRIENLEKKISKIEDKKIKEQYEFINYQFSNGSTFDLLYDKIEELEDAIETYIKETILKSTFEKNKEIIFYTHKRLVEKYNNAPLEYKILTYNTNYDINTPILELLELFRRGCRKYKDLEFFSLFDEITFMNPSEDAKIIRKINKRLKDKNNKVYIKINLEVPEDEYSFFWFDKENMIMYRICNNSDITQTEISYEQIDEDYITLEEFLDESTFIGENRMKLNCNIIGLIYTRYEQSIYREKDKFYITKDITLIQEYNKNNEYLNRFKDKKYTYELIEEQLRELLENYKNYTLTSYDNDRTKTKRKNL